MPPKKQCMTNGCENIATSRGVCSKCYGTLRTWVHKGKITWDQAVESSLCLAVGQQGSAMVGAIETALGASDSAPPQIEQEHTAPHLDEPPKSAAPQMPQIDATPAGYADYDPNAPAAADAPPKRQSRPELPQEQFDTEQGDVGYDYDEDPEHAKRRRAIENRHREERKQEYVEEFGIIPPTGGKVLQVPGAKRSYSLDSNPNQQVTGVGAGPAPGAITAPGIYLQPHAESAQQTFDGEPLLPNWSVAEDGVNLIDPNGKLVDTTPKKPVVLMPSGPAEPAQPTDQPQNGKAIVLASDKPAITQPLIIPEQQAPSPEPIVQPEPAPPAPPIPGGPSADNAGKVPQGPEPMATGQFDSPPWE